MRRKCPLRLKTLQKRRGEGPRAAFVRRVAPFSNSGNQRRQQQPSRGEGLYRVVSAAGSLATVWTCSRHAIFPREPKFPRNQSRARRLLQTTFNQEILKMTSQNQ